MQSRFIEAQGTVKAKHGACVNSQPPCSRLALTQNGFLAMTPARTQDPAFARDALSFGLMLTGPFDGLAARDRTGVTLATLVSCCW